MCAFGTKVQNLILFFNCAQSPGAPACSHILGTHIWENCPFFCNYTEFLSERIFRMVLKRGCHSLMVHFWLWLFCSEAKIMYVNGSWKEEAADVLDFGICLQMLRLDIFCVHISQTKTASAKILKWILVFLCHKKWKCFQNRPCDLELLHVWGVTIIWQLNSLLKAACTKVIQFSIWFTVF